MADKEATIVLNFNEGVTEGLVPDVANGAVLRSENTRLTSTRGTVSRRPGTASAKSFVNAPKCGGLVRGVRDSVCAYFKPEVGQQRIVDGSVEPVYIPDAAGVPGANAYYPYPLVASGSLTGGLVRTAPATCFDSAGRQWFGVVNATNATDSSVSLAVLDAPSTDRPEGQELVTLRSVVTQTGYVATWCAITPWFTQGVVLWYETATGIQARIYTIAMVGAQATLSPFGAAVVVYNSLRNYEVAICSDGAANAWIACRHSATATTAVLLRVNQSSLAVTSTLSFPLALPATADEVYYSAAFWESQASVTNVAMSLSTVTGAHLQATVNATGMSVIGQITTFDGYGRVSALPMQTLGQDSVIFAVTVGTTTAPGVGYTYTRMSERSRTAPGTLIGNVDIPWYIIQGPGVSHTVNLGSETYPYFPLAPRWSLGIARAGTALYQDVPQIVIVTPFKVNGGIPVATYTPVMRCAVDRLSSADGQVPHPNPSCALGPTGRFSLTYLTDRLDLPTTQAGYSPRYATFDLEFEGQPSTASETARVGLVAASMPVSWDGRNTIEHGFFTRPFVAVDTTTGGTGPALTGTYSYTAVVTWMDLAGQLRRSAPANPVTVTIAAKKPIIRVTMPLTMCGLSYDITIFATLPGGSTYIAIQASGLTKGVNGMWEFATVFDTVAGQPQLYSLGGANEELLPECPPPAYDMRSIAGRVWLIDAEDRYRLLPSKRKQSSAFIEFSGNLEIVGFDPQYGRLMAVVDVGGVPYVLASQGIWRVDGYGPDNAGSGAFFGDPQLVSNQGCRKRESVAQIPSVGVMFQNADGLFCLLTPQGVKSFNLFGRYDVGAPMTNLLETELVYPLGVNGVYSAGFLAYNWELDGWTKWEGDTRQVSSAMSVHTYSRSRSLYYTRTPGFYGDIMRMDSDALDTDNTHSIILERGWIAPEAPQGDCVIREFYLHAVTPAAHSLRIRAAFDYDTSQYVEQTWTWAELSALLQDGRYTVGINCEHTPARAVYVTVEATPAASGDFFQPLSLTVMYAANSGVRRRTLLEGALK